jgi:hypothetical protein
MYWTAFAGDTPKDQLQNYFATPISWRYFNTPG